MRNSTQDKNQTNSIGENKTFRIDKKDLAIMSIMTFIYLAIAILNLGTTKVPKTYWKPTVKGESFTVRFDKERNLSKMSYYDGVGLKYLKVEYLTMDGNFKELPDLKIEPSMNLSWNTYSVSQATKALRFTVDLSEGTLNEMVLFEKGSEKPIEPSSITKENISAKSGGTVENLFDEQHFDTYENRYMNSAYFDEIYHPRTAFENINRMEISETSHPPLGKLIIALGIMIFGMNPFGWRIMGTLFGAAMIPLMYLFGIKVFSKKICGVAAAFLMMFDFMHFAQTRIGTIDSYATFFIILSYYFMYDSFIKKSYIVGIKKSLVPLLLSGVFWGLGCASKWTAVYAGGGLAVLYFLSKIMEFKDYKKFISQKKSKKTIIPSWTEGFIKKSIIIPTVSCILFFIVIPAIIYTASYIPIITLPGPQHNLNEVLEYQKDMYGYHSDLEATHPYQSTAGTWPWVKKPLYEYKGKNLPEGKVSVIYVLGNPTVFWFGIISVFLAFIISILKRDKRIIPLLVAFSFQYLPWFFIDRCLFIYHFFTATPFMMLCTVYILYYIKDGLAEFLADIFMCKDKTQMFQKAANIFLVSYVVITIALFALFYPSMTGLVVDKDYLNFVEWLGVRY